jgi:DNA-binding NtrC family response regulator
MRDSSSPAFRVYSAIPRQANSADWLSIGLAVPHQDGKGFDVILQALPLSPKLVLRDCTTDLLQTLNLSDPGRHRDPGRALSFKQQVDAFERALIEQCLLETGGNISAVMERLDLPRRTLSDKMARLGIDRRRLILGASAKAIGERSAEM